MELKQGLFRIDPKTYHALPGLSYTGIKDFERSPSHFLSALAGERVETPAMKFGSAYHAYLLENPVFQSQYVVRPDGLNARTKEGMAWAAQVGAGQEVLSYDENQKIRGMASVLWQHPQWKILSPGSEREIALIWKDDSLDIWCRTRIDLLQPALRVPVDLKTAVDARPVAFTKAALTHGYHIQAAWTLRGLKAVTGHEHETFIFLVQEKEEPYAIQVYEALPEFLEYGNMRINDVLPRYAECLHTNVWPGYDPALKPLPLPAWITEQEQIATEE